MTDHYVLAYSMTYGLFFGRLASVHKSRVHLTEARRVGSPVQGKGLPYLAMHGLTGKTLVSETTDEVLLHDVTQIVRCVAQIASKIRVAPANML